VTIIPNSIKTGRYKVKITYFYSYDGQYYGGEDGVEKEISINIINGTFGLNIDMDNEQRIISKSSGETLSEEDEMTMQLNIGKAMEDINLRVELYKRDATYSEDTFTGISYHSVNLQDYFSNIAYTINEEEKALTSNDRIKNDSDNYTNEYLMLNELNDDDSTEITIKFDPKDTISTGEYKISYKLYYEIGDEQYIQDVTKTFIVIN
jgi:hypothetical protein